MRISPLPNTISSRTICPKNANLPDFYIQRFWEMRWFLKLKKSVVDPCLKYTNLIVQSGFLKIFVFSNLFWKQKIFEFDEPFHFWDNTVYYTGFEHGIFTLKEVIFLDGIELS